MTGRLAGKTEVHERLFVTVCRSALWGSLRPLRALFAPSSRASLPLVP